MDHQQAQQDRQNQQDRDERTKTGPDLVGGRISLDFVNSEGGERNEPPDWIGSYDDLLAWAAHANVLADEEAERLRSEASGRPEEAERTAARAVRFREALYRVLMTSLDGETPAPDDRQIFDEEISAAHAHLRLREDEHGWRWTFEDGGELDAVLWPLALDAADLLTSDAFDRVKECAGPSCTWLFLDQSRNRSRRWCDMAECGNRSKARRYYRRSKEKTGDDRTHSKDSR